MYFIVVKFVVKPQYVEQWPELSRPFTEATRAEPGNMWFDWSRSIDSPDEYVLVEAFCDDEAAGAHVNSQHFQQMQQDFPQYLVATPKIISRKVEGDGWGEMGELTVG